MHWQSHEIFPLRHEPPQRDRALPGAGARSLIKTRVPGFAQIGHSILTMTGPWNGFVISGLFRPQSAHSCHTRFPEREMTGPWQVVDSIGFV